MAREMCLLMSSFYAAGKAYYRPMAPRPGGTPIAPNSAGHERGQGALRPRKPPEEGGMAMPRNIHKDPPQRDLDHLPPRDEVPPGATRRAFDREDNGGTTPGTPLKDRHASGTPLGGT